MRIEVRDTSKSAALRDYFRRLGATAVDCGDGTVDVHVPPAASFGRGGDEIAGYLHRWTIINETDASIIDERSGVR